MRRRGALRKPDGSETGFIFPADPLHKKMAELSWPVVRDTFLLPEKPASETSKGDQSGSSRTPQHE